MVPPRLLSFPVRLCVVRDTGVSISLLSLANSGGDFGMNGDHNGWCIDKRIPIAVVALILAQSLAIGIWVGSIDTRVEAAEEQIDRMGPERHESRISVLESQMSDIRATLNRIADRLGVEASNQSLPRPQPPSQPRGQ